MTTHDINELERKLQVLGESTVKLAAAKHADAMIKIIHGPGYTTIAEHTLLNAMVDGIQHQVTGLQRAYDALSSAANMIGK
jgi:hypothetical protein